jgi:putative salt-induced outer membrane protein YdiY
MRYLPHGLLVCALVAQTVAADELVLKNGDTLHGTIGQVTAEKVKFKSDELGELTLDAANVKSYKIDAPTVVQLKDAPPVTAPVSGEGNSIKAGEQSYTFDTVKSVNPPPEAWTGAIIANFALARGNTNRFAAGVDAMAQLRRDNYSNDDRLTLAGQYNFGQTGGGPAGGDKTTDTDNWMALGKYDNFWTDKLYGYAALRVDHDRIAALKYRLTPTLGLGYQWIESPETNFNTEAGLGYIVEKYDDGSTNNHVAGRLAYHFDHRFNDGVMLFHNLEWVPAITDPGDYNLLTDAGVRVKLAKDFIGQFKVEYRRDSTPADGALKNDLLYMIGLGWQF